MIVLTLMLYGVPVIRTRPMDPREAAAREARWAAHYYRIGTIVREVV